MPAYEVEWRLRGMELIPDARDTDDAEFRVREKLTEELDYIIKDPNDLEIVSFMEVS